jgi:hypothetical protein
VEGPVRVLMKPANHRSTGMRHSPRLLPLGHWGSSPKIFLV